MKITHRGIPTILAIALLLAPVRDALAQSATVDVSAQKQYVRGFGGMVHIPWAGDLSASERTLAFGNADGQLGFTILRIAVPDGSTSNSSYVATAKAAIAAGGIVYASPWNSGGSMNSSEFATYADHLASFVSYMKGQGAELYAISVQNEPDYGASGGWRSWTAAQCHDFVLNYGDKVGTKLMSCESFNYSKGLYDPILNDEAALAKLGVLGAHLYGTSVNSFPYPLFDQKAAGKVERWMTEHYTDSNTDANQWPNALNVATELHNSMVEAQFNAYTWWYIKRSYGPINNGVTKRGWCMAHWSKFVRPGYYRVDATKKPSSSVSLSAYKGTSDVILVAVNTGGAASLDVSIKGATVASCDKYTTSSSKNLASDGKVSVSGGSLSTPLDGSSVTTLRCTSSDIPVTGTGGSTGGGGSSGSGGATGGGGSSGRPDGSVGRDASGAGGAVGTGGSTGDGTGGRAGGDAGPPGREAGAAGGAVGPGGAPGTGGTTARGTGGAPATGGSPTGSGGSRTGGEGGQVGSGGAPGATGGTVSGGGGVQGTGGGSTEVSTDAGCSCRVGQPKGRSAAGAVFLVLPLLVWARSRRRRLGR